MEKQTLVSNIDGQFDDSSVAHSNRRGGIQGRPFLNMIVALCVLITLGLILEISSPSRLSKDMEPKYNSSISYTENVRENVRKLLEDRSIIMYQPQGGIIRPFVNKMAKYTTAPQYKLSHCFVPKVMATTQEGFFCYLRDSEGFEKAGLDLKTVYWGNKFCGGNGTAFQTAELVDYLPPKHFTFQMTRDPIKRFVSAFVNKCVIERRFRASYNDTKETCYGCDEDLKCVTEQLYKEVYQVSRLDRGLTQRIRFRDYFTEHFMPLTWYCDLAKRFDEVEYIPYVSGGEKKVEMAGSILTIMERAGVESHKLKKMKDVLLDDEPLTHATKGSDLPAKYLKEIYTNKEILETLKKLYYYDFIVFNYPMPELQN